MLNDMDQRTRLLYPLFQNIFTKLNPSYRSVEITGNSKVRYLKYRYPNPNYERRSVDTEYCVIIGFVFLFVILVSMLFFDIPNTFWSNFCFYTVSIGSMIFVYHMSGTVKEGIVTAVIVLIDMLLLLEIFYWVSYCNISDPDMRIFHKNLSTLWPDFIFKFVFK